jgi:Domain of unknown function (DUF1707)
VASDPTRASDADRERVVGWLRDGHYQGRLTVEELDERIARAYAAVTRGELADVVRDLPVPRAGMPVPAAPPPMLMPGRAPFSARWLAPADPRAEVMERVVPLCVANGYRIVHQGANQLVLQRRRIPVWAIVIAVVFFPLGLLALLAKETDVVTVDITSTPDGAPLTHVHGIAPVEIRAPLAQRERR